MPTVRAVRLVVVKYVSILRRQPLRVHESDLATLGVRTQYPGDLLHLAQAWVLPIDVRRAEGHWKRDAIVVECEHSAFDNLVAKACASNNAGIAAGVTERRITFVAVPPRILMFIERLLGV